MRLLLADDDEDQLGLRSLTLAKAGYEVSQAVNEQSAIQLAIAQTPDVAIVDLRIPTEEAGLRLIRALRKLDAKLRIIVLSGADPKRFEALPERALVDAVMTKGSASRKLLEYLKGAIAGEAGGRA
jgi:DNA-binding response OmpR family regulator